MDKKQAMDKTKTTRYDVAEHLRTPEEMAAYLEACFESGELEENSVISILETTAQDGNNYQINKTQRIESDFDKETERLEQQLNRKDEGVRNE